MGEASAHASNEAVVVAVDSHGQTTRKVIFQLHRIGHGLAALTDIRQSAGEQVGVTVLPEPENHRCTHVEGVALSVEAAPRPTGDQIPFQHQGFGPLGCQLGGCDQTADSGADHDHVPCGLAHSGCRHKV